MTVGGGDVEGRLERLPVSGRRRPGPFTIAVVLVAAIGASVGAALLQSSAGTAQPSGVGPTTFVAATSGSTTPSPGGPSGTPQSSVEGATQGLENVELPGSPEIVLFQRQGDDLTLLGWRAGEPELGARQVIPGAFRGITEEQNSSSQLSADGSILLLQAGPATDGLPDTFRAFRLDGTGGRLIWESTALGSGVVGSFFGPAQVVITSTSQLATGRGWTIVDLSGDAAVLHELDLPAVPRPTPGTSIDFDSFTFNYVPLAMSADGRSIYAASTHGSEPIYRLAYRIAIETSKAQKVTAFPASGPSRAVTQRLDPVSGRLLLAGPYLTAGPGLVEAWSIGAKTPDFKTPLNNVFAATWLDDGRIVAADYDRLPGPFTFRILTLTPAGKPAATLFSARGTDAAFLGVQRGFAGAYITSRSSGMRTLVVIRLADNVLSAVDVPEPSGIAFHLGLRP